MIAGLLIADMSGTSVLTIIHWVGVVFVFLWFVGSCMKDGLWNNAIRCFNAFLAWMICIPLTVVVQLVLRMIMGEPDGSDPYTPMMVGIGGQWVTFIVACVVLQAITDQFSQVKVTFHPIVNSIGSFIFVCGITLIMFLLCLPIYGVVRMVK